MIITISLDKQTLKVAKGATILATIAMPETIIQYHELIDKDGFNALLSDALTKSNIRGSARLLVGEDWLFSKTMPVKADNNDQTAFFDKVPYAQIATSMVVKDGQKTLYATNKALVDALVEICSANNVVVTSATVGHDEKVWKQCNFLQANPDQSASSLKRPFFSKRMRSVFAVSIFASGTLLLALTVYRFQTSSMVSSRVVAPIVASPVVSASPAIVFVSKAAALVEVLNASGISGQAAKIKKQLTDFGFQRIEASNAAIAKGTIVTFKETVGMDLRHEIIVELQKNLSQVASQSATPSAYFDVSIVVGK